MKTEQEIQDCYKKCVDSNGYISPSVLEALEWVLELEGCESLVRQLKEMDLCECGHERVHHKHDGENHTGSCSQSNLEQGVRIYCNCMEFKEKS